MKKCIISFLLSMCMACSLLPGKAWAAEVDPVPKQTVEQQPDVTSTSGGNQEPTNEDPSNGEENKKANDTGDGKGDSGSAGGTQQKQKTEDGQSDDGSQKDGTLKSNANQQPSDGSQSEVNQESIESSKAVVENNNDPTTVTVSNGKAYVESTKQEYESLDAAMKAAAQSDTIYLGMGIYCGNSANPTVKGNGAGKSLTFVGAGTDKTTWQIRALDKPAVDPDGPCDYSFEGSSSITFKNMTIVGSVYSNGTTVNAKDLQGLVRIQNITLEDCIFNGRADYWGYASTTFKNVTFNAPGTDASGVAGVSNTNYSLWTYTGNTYTFKGCTFNSTGKTINVYRHKAEQFQDDVTINYENCTVNNSTHKKQALKINDSTAGEHKYIINISGENKVNGIEPNSITCSRLFGFDENSENAGNTIVKIENQEVWKDGERVGDHNQDFSTGSYNNGETKGTDNKYTDGYKDDAFTTTYSSWTWNEDKKQLARTVTKTCKYCGEEVTTTEYKDFELDVSRSKTATALDSSNQSTVTLSLPSAEAKLSSDVVFVLDASDCVGNVMGEISALVVQLENVQKEANADIKIGAVIFNGSAYTMFDGKLVDSKTAIEKLKDLSNNATSEEAVWKYFGLDEDSNYVNKGSNLHSGLLGAQALLQADTTVDNSRKYVVTVTDGMTYYWNDDKGNVYGIYSGSNANGSDYPSLLFYAWCEAHNISMAGSYTLPADFEWDDYLEKAKELEEKDAGEYTVNVRNAKDTLASKDFREVRFSTVSALTNADIPYIPKSEAKEHAHGMDYSVTACLSTYQEMVDAGYQCYTLNSKISEFNESTFPGLFISKLNKMAGKEVVNFNSIQNDILYAVGAGSVVEDKMGDAFDFAGLDTMTLTIGTGETSTTLSRKIETNTNTAYFGDGESKDLDENNCRFKVEYNSTDDKFTWTINENVSNFAPVQLSYKVTLVKRNTAAGTYSVPTNEYARLTPKNSAGQTGKELEFNKPEVTYTVSDSGSGGGESGSSDTSSSTSTAATAVLGAVRAPEVAETVAEEPEVLGAEREPEVLGATRGQEGTGDESHMAAWGGAAAGALALLALYFGIKNRKNRRF